VAAQGLLHPPPGRHHGVHGPGQQVLDLVDLQQVVEPAEGQHQAGPGPAHRHAAEAHQQLQRRLRPQLRIVGKVVERVEGERQGRGLLPRLRLVHGRGLRGRRHRTRIRHGAW
jgi:hypothetical protein